MTQHKTFLYPNFLYPKPTVYPYITISLSLYPLCTVACIWDFRRDRFIDFCESFHTFPNLSKFTGSYWLTG